MSNKISYFEEEFGKNRIRLGEKLSSHTSFKIGGEAEYYLEVSKTDDLIKAVNICRKIKMPFFILGGGSNMLMPDTGIKGLTIKNNCRKFDVMRMSGRVKNQKIDVSEAFVFAESGVIMNQLVRFTIEQGLGGLEYHLGLPGTVGGAIFMNSNFPKKNTYVGDRVYMAKVLTKEGIVKEVNNSYFKFGYDESVLQKSDEILLSVLFKLISHDKKVLWERATEALNHRNNTQPKGISAGCVFRNISIADAINIPTPNRITSVGYLIDKAGLKGKRIGDAMVSETHANFIMNLGNAKSKDVMDLIDIIKEEVYKKFNVNLELEIKVIKYN